MLEIVKSKYGLLKSVRSNKGYALFRGIPYAKAPVGELRYEDDIAYIGGGKTGELTQKLYDTITGIQWGKIPDDMGWSVSIEA